MHNKFRLHINVEENIVFFDSVEKSDDFGAK